MEAHLVFLILPGALTLNYGETVVTFLKENQRDFLLAFLEAAERTSLMRSVEVGGV